MPLLTPDDPPSFERHPMTPRAIGLLAAGAALIVLIGWALGEPLDDASPLRVELDIMTAVAAWRTEALTAVLVALSFVGNFFVSAALCLLLVVVARWRTRSWAASWLVGLSLLGSLFVTGCIKLLVDRERPLEALVGTHSSAFPSGHASRVVALLGLATWAVWLLVRHPVVRALAVGTLVVLIVASGGARVYLGVHWPTDVLFGFALGMWWLLVVLQVTQPRVRTMRARARGGGTTTAAE